MSDPRIEAAAIALLEVFQMRSQYAVASSPLALATVAINAADAADPARRLRVVTSREQLSPVMIAEMGDIIAAHSRARRGFVEEPTPGYIDLGVCECGAALWDEGTEREDWDKLRAAHVAEELAKAGYGKLATHITGS